MGNRLLWLLIDLGLNKLEFPTSFLYIIVPTVGGFVFVNLGWQAHETGISSTNAYSAAVIVMAVVGIVRRRTHARMHAHHARSRCPFSSFTC